MAVLWMRLSGSGYVVDEVVLNEDGSVIGCVTGEDWIGVGGWGWVAWGCIYCGRGWDGAIL